MCRLLGGRRQPRFRTLQIWTFVSCPRRSSRGHDRNFQWTGEEFRECVRQQCRLQPDREQRHGKLADTDWHGWWVFVCALPCVCASGAPALKFSRWSSCQEVWDHYVQQWYFFGWILRQAGDSTFAEANPGDMRSRAVWDTQLNAVKRGAGLLKRLPGYINDSVAAGMFFVVSPSHLRTCTSGRPHL